MKISGVFNSPTDEAQLMNSKLSPADASILALYAENPNISEDEVGDLFVRMSPAAQGIAIAVKRAAKGDELAGDPIEIVSAAHALLRWADSNRRRV